MLKIGDKAPDFTLLDGDENSVSLSDFKGQRVVLWFFPTSLFFSLVYPLTVNSQILKSLSF